jgi:hypothetical protein
MRMSPVSFDRERASIAMVPGIPHAAARHNAPVIGIARCGFPIEIIRHKIPCSDRDIGSPESVAMSAGGPKRAIYCA